MKRLVESVAGRGSRASSKVGLLVVTVAGNQVVMSDETSTPRVTSDGARVRGTRTERWGWPLTVVKTGTVAEVTEGKSGDRPSAYSSRSDRPSPSESAVASAAGAPALTETVPRLDSVKPSEAA